MLSHAHLTRLVPRAAILLTAIAAGALGDPLYGVFCLLALAITLVPAIRARRLDAGVPLELELALLWLMLTDMTLGNALGLYQLAWYDKALHLTSSLLVGLMGFLAIYVLHAEIGTKMRAWLLGIAILLVTLGLGALWEIAEYGVDQLFGRRTQGSPTLSALDDTMLDLMLDALGGIAAAILGPIYMQRSRFAPARKGSARPARASGTPPASAQIHGHAHR